MAIGNFSVLKKAMSTLKEGTVYALVDPHGTRQYVGSTAQSLETRFKLHAASAAKDPLASPLYRHCAKHWNGSLDGWRIVRLLSIAYDPAITPRALQEAETNVLNALRASGDLLLNKNAPVDMNHKRREYMRAWRRRPENRNYMAKAGQRHREKRRKLVVSGTVPIDTFTTPKETSASEDK